MACSDVNKSDERFELLPDQDPHLKDDSFHHAEVSLGEDFYWDDTIGSPDSSFFVSDVLHKDVFFGSWLHDTGDMAFSVSPDWFTIGSMDYVYSLIQDSLRVYTKADHPDGGVDRGIVEQMDPKQIKIYWSTGDTNSYYKK